MPGSRRVREVITPGGVAMVSRRKRRRRVRAANVGITLPLRSTRPRRRRKTLKAKPMGTTVYGKQFLQSVLAPYDFAQLGCSGVPDDFAGPSFTVVQRQIFKLAQVATPTFYAICPSAQIGLWTCGSSVPNNLSIWLGSSFADQSVFPTDVIGTPLIDSARVIGLTAELKCMSPRLTVNGSVTVCRSEIRLEQLSNPQIIAVAGATAGTVSVVGLASAAAGISSSSNYTGRAEDGFFSVARHMGPWAFSDNYQIEGVAGGGSNDILVPNFGSTGRVPDDGTLRIAGASTNTQLDWFDNNMESITFSLDGASVNPASFTLEVMMVIECRPAKNTVFAKVAAPSPPFDAHAMEMYKAMSYNMPIAVMAKENARWWETLLALLKTGGYIASHIPGPIGGIGGGVQAVAMGFEELFI